MRVALALVGIYTLLGVLAHQQGALGIDRTAFDAVAEIRTKTGVDIMRHVTDLGSFPVAAAMVAATGVVAYRHGRGSHGLALAVGLLITVALISLTKELWDRPRPANRLDDVSSMAYPSGHMAYAMAWVAAAGLTRRRAVIAAATALAVAIGLSRLYLHVHYLTDVLGGAALAGAVFLVVLRRA